METRRMLALAAVLSAGVSAPALAEWDRIGSVDVSFRADHDTQYGNFGGSVEKLALRAERSGVMCRNVSATFGNGQTVNIFRGALPEGRDVTVDLPGDQRLVRRVDLNCRAEAPQGAVVQISADIGRYRDEWRRSSDWDRFWSHRFRWADSGSDHWMTLGTQRFDGRRDHDAIIAGPRGRNIDMVGLKPDADARCSRIVATFRDGRRMPFEVNRRLVEDRIYQIDLPGRDRDLARLDLNCHAERGRSVTIQVLASR